VPEPAIDPPAAPARPHYTVPATTLLAMVRTPPRPAADAADAVWDAVVQESLDRLAAFDPRHRPEVMLTIQIIAANAGALDAYRIAFEPGTIAAEALRHRAGAASLTRAMMGAMRLLKRQRVIPALSRRDWHGAAPEGALQAAPARPTVGAKHAEAEPETIIRRLHRVSDDDLAAEVERRRHKAAGEPGPMRVCQHQPDGYALRWKPDP
jgi:hypothetical protein